MRARQLAGTADDILDALRPVRPSGSNGTGTHAKLLAAENA
jgi:hypothetical protein